MLPSDPIAHFVIAQSRLALGPLQALFNSMFRFGGPEEFFDISFDVGAPKQRSVN